MTIFALFLVGGSVLLVGYAYIGYPLILRLLARRPTPPPADPPEWPRISLSVPVYNEEGQIRGLLDSLLELDYPVDRRQILVISDASSDGTDSLVREYADRGVELLRLPQRSGKTAAETAGAALLTGEIVVNTDASIRILPGALKSLIARFSDPEVGVASGRDVSVARFEDDSNVAEAGYVGYEMAIRRLETSLGGIIGASGCFYAIRTALHRAPLARHLSRDFAAALIAREHGYRAVSVDEAVCLVPRTSSLQREYRRKVRTISRGMETLWCKRQLLNPLRYGGFAWKLWSHKVARWLTPWAAPAGLLGLALLAPEHPWAGAAILAAILGGVLGVAGWLWPEDREVPRVLGFPASIGFAAVAAMMALYRAARGDEDPTWEPTRREIVLPAPAGRR
jgi:cellulose synthase/poly-beta-1,6-N-acetylglucosamine synthase-like glycosyltransferase